MKKQRHLQNVLCLSLPLYLTCAAGLTTLTFCPAKAAHSEPVKSAKATTTVAAAKTTAAPPELTPATLLGLVRSAKILDPEYPVHVTLANQEAELATVRHPKATDQDCKIDAVLVAKAVMDIYPKEVIRIKLLLGASGNDVMQEITVTKGDVKAFATGTISKEELLDSLEIKKADNASAEKESNNIDLQTEGGTPVAPGAYRNQRQLLQGRIDHLRARGTGTKPYEEMLAKIETDVQKPVSDMPRFAVQKEIGQLNGLLNEQEQALREAQHIADGTNARFSRFYGMGRGGGAAGGLGNGGGLGGGAAGGRQGGGLRQIEHQNPDYARDLEHIRELRQQGNKDQAAQERKSLMARMKAAGVSAGNGSGGGPSVGPGGPGNQGSGQGNGPTGGGR